MVDPLSVSEPSRRDPLHATSNFTIKWPGRRTGSGSPGSQFNCFAAKLKPSKSLICWCSRLACAIQCCLQIPCNLAQRILLLLALTRKPSSDQTFLLAHICTTQHCSRFQKKRRFQFFGWVCDTHWKRKLYGNTNKITTLSLHLLLQIFRVWSLSLGHAHDPLPDSSRCLLSSALPLPFAPRGGLMIPVRSERSPALPTDSAVLPPCCLRAKA